MTSLPGAVAAALSLQGKICVAKFNTFVKLYTTEYEALITSSYVWIYHIDGSVQDRRNSIANALELRLSCTNPSISSLCYQTHSSEYQRYQSSYNV